MSSIIRDKRELMILKDIIEYMDLNDLNKCLIEDILKELIPKSNNKYLIKYCIRDRGYSTACFVPEFEKIVVTINKAKEWIELNSKGFAELYKVKDIETLKKYMFIYILVHEIEHSYQYLMAKGVIEAPNKNIEIGYKGIFELCKKNNSPFPNLIKEGRKTISLILYNLKVNDYILERNANVECTDLLCKCAIYMDREDIYIGFNNMRNSFLAIGYIESKKGCLEETYSKILMHDRYKKFYEEVYLNEEDRIRYGFNVNEETRKKVLLMGKNEKI